MPSTAAILRSEMSLLRGIAFEVASCPHPQRFLEGLQAQGLVPLPLYLAAKDVLGGRRYLSDRKSSLYCESDLTLGYLLIAAGFIVTSANWNGGGTQGGAEMGGSTTGHTSCEGVEASPGAVRNVHSSIT